MPESVVPLIAVGVVIVLFIVLLSVLTNNYSLNGIKSKTVGDGQHGTARWATTKEVKKTFANVPFDVASWRAGKNLPEVQGLILGSTQRGKQLDALVDRDDVHCLMIGASGVGKTDFFLYPNLEFACASGMSYVALDTKGDLSRNYGTIAKKYYGYHVSGADGAGAPALWRRQKEKLLPFMQEEKPKIGTGTAGVKLTVLDSPENKVRFAGLLRAFSVLRENRHVSDADFSYSWYAYGMEHYNGVALIEPLEYSEERKLRELAIVIDTSASCSRGLTGWFLRAVHDILLRERLFFDRFRLHILQCDCEVQQDTLVTNLEEFQWYLDHLELYGGGGTDFRPALRRIDELVACGELPHLGGVLYFTDGYGVFPEREPAYPVAFVMLRYRYDDINIPRWAIRLVLDADKPGRDEGWI